MRRHPEVVSYSRTASSGFDIITSIMNSIWWILTGIIIAFVVWYLIVSLRRKVDRNEHVEPASMRPDARLDKNEKRDDDLRRSA